MSISLKVEPRQQRGKHARNILAREGKIPGVFYGREIDSMPIAMDAIEFNKLIQKFGTSKIMDLQFNGEKHKVILKEVQYNILNQQPIHADFQKVVSTEKIKTSVHVKLVGEPAGAHEGGTLQQQLEMLDVECLPLDLPDNIEVDVSDMQIGDSIYVSDLTLPETIEVTNASEAVVATVLGVTDVEAELEEAEQALEEPLAEPELADEDEEEEAEGEESEE